MQAKYDHIGKGYNKHRMADPYLAARLRNLLNPKNAGTYLDIGCGTGNYTVAVFSPDSKVIGIDPSVSMLKIAESRRKNFIWLKGSAEQTNLDDNSVDGILATLTIHHWNDLTLAFHEMFRVMKKAGTMVVFTSTPNQMKGYWLNHYFPKMLRDSIIQMPSAEDVKEAASRAGFTDFLEELYFVKDDLQDLFLYAGKNRPELYFDEEVRRGISSFSSLANREEVEVGLEELRKDHESGALNTIREKYQNDLGDYLFLRFSKAAN